MAPLEPRGARAGIRVATWNIRDGVPEVPGPADPLRELVRLTRELDVDILGLQEVPFVMDGRSPALDALRAGTPLQHTRSLVLSESYLVQDGRSGLAVASRYPIESEFADLLPNPGLRAPFRGAMINSFDKGMISADVRVDGQVLRMTSVHLFPFHRFLCRPDEPRFDKVWDGLAEHVSEGLDGVVIVAGDFNTGRRDLILDRLPFLAERAVGDRDTHAGMAADDVLLSKGSRATAEAMLVNNFSDHQLCVVDLALD